MTTTKSQQNVEKHQGGLFYGWWILGAGVGTQFLMALLWIQSYGAYVVLFREEFAWSKSIMSAAFSLSQLISGLLAPIQGWLIDKVGSRILINVGTVFFGLSLIAMSKIESLFGFYCVLIFLTVGASLAGFATVTTAIVIWFRLHRARALAISQTSYSIGGLCVPIVILGLDLFGWRTTVLISGVLALVVGLPLAQIFRRSPSPEEQEKEFSGNSEAPPQKRAAIYGPAKDFSARQAFRTPAFWLVSFGHGSALLAVSAVMVHLVPHLTENLSYSLSEAGFIVALMTACQLGGQLIGILFGDRFNKPVVCALCMLGHMAALLLLGFASNITMVFGFALLHGVSWGIRGPLMVALRADHFGSSSFGKIMGLSVLIAMLGMTLGPLIGGVLADIYGNYQASFSVLAIGVFFGFTCFLFATPPKIPSR